MTFIFSGTQADPQKPESLVESSALLVVGRMTATVVELLMGVCRLRLKICHQAISITYYFCVEECYRLQRPLIGELDCWMEGIYLVKEYDQFLIAMQPNSEYIIKVPPPYQWFISHLL